jgi:hypothetical protein
MSAMKKSAATGDVLVQAVKHAEKKHHRELSSAFAPLVVTAIRSEIKRSKDMIVEALYPIMGRLVTAAVAAAFRDLVETLNTRIDALVSAHSWRLRMRALATGHSMAEVALAEVETGKLKRALLLERGSGRVLAAWPRSEKDKSNVDLQSGMIAAITEFATNAYADQGGELRMLDLGASNVFLRASPRVIVAAEFGGELPRHHESRLDDAFLSIVERHEKDETACTSEAIAGHLNEALASEAGKPKSKTPVIVFGLVMGALAIWAASGPVTRAWRESRIRSAFDAAMVPYERLAHYPLRLLIDHKGGRVILRGLAASSRRWRPPPSPIRSSTTFQSLRSPSRRPISRRAKRGRAPPYRRRKRRSIRCAPNSRRRALHSKGARAKDCAGSSNPSRFSLAIRTMC